MIWIYLSFVAYVSADSKPTALFVPVSKAQPLMCEPPGLIEYGNVRNASEFQVEFLKAQKLVYEAQAKPGKEKKDYETPSVNCEDIPVRMKPKVVAAFKCRIRYGNMKEMKHTALVFAGKAECDRFYEVVVARNAGNIYVPGDKVKALIDDESFSWK